MPIQQQKHEGRLWLMTAIPRQAQAEARERGHHRARKAFHEGVPIKAQPHKAVRGQVTKIASRMTLEREAVELRERGFVVTFKRWRPPKSR